MFATLTFAALAAATPIADIGAQFAAETSTDHVACSAQEPERIVCFGLDANGEPTDFAFKSNGCGHWSLIG